MINYKEIDVMCVPMVRFFNEIGLKTESSCQGHDENPINDFFIMFEDSVTDDMICNFVNKCSSGCLYTPFMGKFEKWVRKCGDDLIANWIYSVSYCVADKNQRFAAQDFQVMVIREGGD